MDFNQHGFDVRCEWGSVGLAHLLGDSDAVVIVDVLSFSTCVDIAVSNGALVYPYHVRDESAVTYAKSMNAVLALPRTIRSDVFSLSPTSLQTIPSGTRLVLPSPNGSTLSLATRSIPTIAGCLRNAQVVASAVNSLGSRISVIAAGEQWPDGSLRVALEDLIGAGAIIHYLQGTRSPEAQMAELAFIGFKSDLATVLDQCGSARELSDRGYARDVALALELNQSDCVPILIDGAYTRFGNGILNRSL